MGVSPKVLWATMLATVWTAGLAAQDRIPAGARVQLRLKAPRPSPFAPDTFGVAVKGRAVAVDGDALLVVRESLQDTVSVPLDSIRTLKAVTGQRHPIREGALVGAILGAGVGAAVGLTTNQCPNGGVLALCFNARPVRSRPAGALVGALLGVAVGILSANLFEVDRWQGIEPKRVRVAVVPDTRGVSLGATIAF